MIEFRKCNISVIYYLSCHPHWDVANFPLMPFTVIFLPIQDPGLYNALSCQISVPPLAWNHVSAFKIVFSFFLFKNLSTLPFLNGVGPLFSRLSRSSGLSDCALATQFRLSTFGRTIPEVLLSFSMHGMDLSPYGWRPLWLFGSGSVCQVFPLWSYHFSLYLIIEYGGGGGLLLFCF